MIEHDGAHRVAVARAHLTEQCQIGHATPTWNRAAEVRHLLDAEAARGPAGQVRLEAVHDGAEIRVALHAACASAGCTPRCAFAILLPHLGKSLARQAASDPVRRRLVLQVVRLLADVANTRRPMHAALRSAIAGWLNAAHGRQAVKQVPDLVVGADEFPRRGLLIACRNDRDFHAHRLQCGWVRGEARARAPAEMGASSGCDARGWPGIRRALPKSRCRCSRTGTRGAAVRATSTWGPWRHPTEAAPTTPCRSVSRANPPATLPAQPLALAERRATPCQAHRRPPARRRPPRGPARASRHHPRHVLASAAAPRLPGALRPPPRTHCCRFPMPAWASACPRRPARWPPP